MNYVCIQNCYNKSNIFALQLADAYEEVEEQRQVVGQWKRRVQKLNGEMHDLRLLLEEQTARNNLLEKKQRKYVLLETPSFFIRCFNSVSHFFHRHYVESIFGNFCVNTTELVD